MQEESTHPQMRAFCEGSASAGMLHDLDDPLALGKALELVGMTAEFQRHVGVQYETAALDELGPGQIQGLDAAAHVCHACHLVEEQLAAVEKNQARPRLPLVETMSAAKASSRSSMMPISWAFFMNRFSLAMMFTTSLWIFSSEYQKKIKSRWKIG